MWHRLFLIVVPCLSCITPWTKYKLKCEEYHDRSFVIYFEYKGMKENRSNGYSQNTANFQESSSAEAGPSKREFSLRHTRLFPWSPTRGVNFKTDVDTFPVGDTCVVSQPKKEKFTKVILLHHNSADKSALHQPKVHYW